MCRNHNHKYSKKPQSPKLKFYRNLRGFFIFNLVMMALIFMGSGFAAFWKISAIWSVFLLINYVKVFGMPGTNGWFSDDWEDWMAEREAQRSNLTGESRRPGWREKDLV